VSIPVAEQSTMAEKKEQQTLTADCYVLTKWLCHYHLLPSCINTLSAGCSLVTKSKQMYLLLEVAK